MVPIQSGQTAHPFLNTLPAELAVEWPGGRVGSQHATVRLKLRHPRQILPLARGHIGTIGQGYVRGDLELEGDPRQIMHLAASMAGNPVRSQPEAPWTQIWRRWRSRLVHRPSQDAEQVRFHYDLGDDFFALWLDPKRVYSCAYYRDPDMTLTEAQEAKLDHVCKKLQLLPGQRFLDIGAGWGGLLFWAAEHYGVHAHGITLSHEQFAYVSRLIREKRLEGRVTVQLMDYRELPSDAQYDRVASIGMCEHVGSANLDTYFAKLRSLLAPGGMLLNHSITAAGVHSSPLGAGMGEFIEAHIFPGGELVHVSAQARSLSASGLELLDVENLRPHYARTLWDWSHALESRLDQARELASEAHVRAYRLYLAGSATAFERGWLSIHQLLASRPDGNLDSGSLRGAQCSYPFQRGHLYTTAEF